VTGPYEIAQHRRRDGDDGPATWVIGLSGEFDITAREELAELLVTRVADVDTAAVTVDLDATTFLDSEAMAALIEGYNAARAAGKPFGIVNPHGVIERSLRIAGLLDLPGLGNTG
jgi:anti-sigma B factor antagonist